MNGGLSSSEAAGISPLQIKLDELRKSVNGGGEGVRKVTFFEKDDKIGYSRTLEISGPDPKVKKQIGVAALIGEPENKDYVFLGTDGKYYAYAAGKVQMEVPEEEVKKSLSGLDTTPVSDGQIRVDRNLTAHVGS